MPDVPPSDIRAVVAALRAGGAYTQARDAAAAAAAAAADGPARGEALLELGRCEADLGRYGAAEEALRDAVRVAGTGGEAVRAEAGAELALIALRDGMPEDAKALAEAAISQAAQVPPPSAAAAGALVNAAIALAETGAAGGDAGAVARAAGLLERALDTASGVEGDAVAGGPVAGGAAGAAQVGRAVVAARGSIARIEGRYEDAVDLLAAAGAERGRPADTRPVDRAAIDAELGVCLRALGRLDEAEAAGRAALRHLEPVGGDTHPDAAVILDNLGALALARAHGDAPAGIALLREVVGRLEAAGAVERPQLAMHWNNLGGALARSGDLDTAADAYERSLARKDAHGAPPASLVVTLVNLAGVQRRRRRWTEAESAYRRALALLDAGPATWDEAPDPRTREVVLDGLRELGKARGPLISLEPRRPGSTRPH